MATNTNDTKIALIQQDIGYIKETLERMIHSMDSMSKTFATKEEHKNNQDRIADLERDRKSVLVETAKWFIMASLGIGVALLMYKL